MEKRILIFSPYQGIPQHSFIEKKLSEILEENASYKVDVIACDGFLREYCVTMSTYGLNFLSPQVEKDKVCVRCKACRSELYGNELGTRLFTIDSFISKEIIELVEGEKIKIEEQLQNYTYEGVTLGLISSYLLILQHKLFDLNNLSVAVKKEYAITIANNLKVYLALKEFLSKKQYQAVVFYNGNYDINNTVINLMKKYFPNSRPILIHYGHNWARSCDKLFLIKKKHNEHLRERMFFFEQAPTSIDLSKYDMREVDEYQQSLMSGNSVFVYSSAKTEEKKDIFSLLKIDPKKPTALMSLSSNDEKFATQTAVTQTDRYHWIELTFADQMEWVEKTVDFFAKHPEWQLILRIHPREFPNKREKVLSRAASFYQKIAEKLPNNVVLNPPNLKVSIYDIFEAVHLHLTSWSTVGLESSMVGLPTISTTRGFGLYPNKYVHFFSQDQNEYFNEIVRVLSEPKKIDKELIARAKRWVLYDFNHTIITFDTKKYWEKKPPFLRRVINKLIFPISPHSYKQFSKSFHIDRRESKVVTDFFDRNKDVFEIKSGL